LLKESQENPEIIASLTDLNKLKWQRNFFVVLSGLLLLFSVGLGKTAFSERSIPSLRNEVKRLNQVNQSKNQLFSIIAHDLRSAVHALQINVSKMKTMLSQLLIKDTIVLVENTEQITVSTHSLLNNLLYWSLSQTGQLNFRRQKISVRDLIAQVCYDFVSIAEAKSIRLNYSAENDCSCIGDLNSVKIVLRNLVDNAIKYTGPSGSVDISVMRGKTECYVTVQDNGIGMDSGLVNAVKNSKGERIQPAADGRGTTGLGLSLAKNMTERNGGVLSILSEEGVGTSVTFSLPIAD
jgi:signal transduction histidine kinase